MKFSFLLLFTLLLCSCIKPPGFPDEPVITFAGLSKTTMNQSEQNTDSIRIFFEFTDGDGDLGIPVEERPFNDFDVVITDARIDVVMDKYYAPYVPPKGATNGIKGNGSILVYTTCCLIDGEQPCAPLVGILDTLVLEMHVFDRSGNMSNTIQTTPIMLRCD